MKLKYFQQGDVLLKPVAKLPEGLKKMQGLVLQESEITGHHHHFRGNAAVDLYTMEESQGRAGTTTITPNFGKFIVVKEEAELFHGTGFESNPVGRGGDHVSLKVPPGIYEVDIVREFDYDAMETTRVVD